MSWVTVIWSMIASACLTLAALYLLVWSKKRTEWAHLLFALAAAGTAGLGCCELLMMRAESTGQFATALRWLHVPAWAIIITLVGFIRVYLRAGRLWLAWSCFGLRTLSLLLDFLTGQNLNYREITRLRQIPFFGEPVAVAEGVANPWMLVGQLSLLLLVIYAADATLTVWRRGDRRQALVVGGSILFFVLAASVQAVLVLWQIVPAPITASVFYLGIVMAMGYELSREALRSAQLSADLRKSEEQRRLAVTVDITARKTAETEATRLRNELTHIARVSMLGQLASSLAHELNQPLGAILRNAEAAELFLQHPSPDLDELRAILEDIRKDDQRAGAVIHRMRSFLQRHEVERHPIDLNELVADVIGLMRADAEMRKVQLAFTRVASLSPVSGDRIQLQQVLLNLLLNALDALQDSAPDARRIAVSIQPAGPLVEVAVSDTGHGIPADRFVSLFEPFFTTKSKGLGMGLPISRTIVEAHGGQIRAENNASGGATFYFTLPVTEKGREAVSSNRQSVIS